MRKRPNLPVEGQSPVSFWTFVSLIQTCLDLPFSKNVDLWVYLRAAPNPLYKNGASKQLPIEQKKIVGGKV